MIEKNQIYVKHDDLGHVLRATIPGSWLNKRTDEVRKKNFTKYLGKFLYETVEKVLVKDNSNWIVWIVRTWQCGHEEEGVYDIILTEEDILNNYSICKEDE